MEKATRRYFVCEGADAEALAEKIWADQDRLTAAMDTLRKQHQASAVFVRDNAFLAFLGFPDSEPREGFKIDTHKTGNHYCGRPDRRTKKGREIEKQLKAASLECSPSDAIVRYYEASRWVPQDDPRSRSGMSMAITVGHPLRDKKRITLDVPVSDEEPFDPPPGVREIKRSEYIALTEEE